MATTMTNSERVLAESLADLLDWAARPLSSYPSDDRCGTQLQIRELAHYPPINEWNVGSGARLAGMYFNTYLRRAEEEWKSLPKAARKRIMIQAALSRCERTLAELEHAVAALDGVSSSEITQQKGETT